MHQNHVNCALIRLIPIIYLSKLILLHLNNYVGIYNNSPKNHGNLGLGPPGGSD